MKSITTTFICALFFFMSYCCPLSAQKGSERIYHDIQKLGVLANVLYVAAHPDDENTRMISYLSNHLHVHTTYVSLTRGDGGQNLIGSEIRDMLGLIRTYELLQARKIDGGHQLFSRANDFGYSKTAAETFAIWGHDEILSDMVWSIRETRPDVIINRFSTDTSRPNHGHHTASAILAVEAFDLAADPKAYPEQLAFTSLWQPRRIYHNTSWWFYGSQEAFAKVDKSRMLAIDIGVFDPVTGESNSEIAGRSRSMHKSQGFGSAETRGESLDYIDLIRDSEEIIPQSLFDGIDITWNRVAGGSVIGEKITHLASGFNFREPSASLPALLDVYQDISALSDSYWKSRKLAECKEIIRACLGLFVEARTKVYSVSPNVSLPVTVEVINRSAEKVQLKSIDITGLTGPLSMSADLPFNQVSLHELTITTPDRLNVPYWLSGPSTDGLYHVPDQKLRGIAADPPPVTASITVQISNIPFVFETPVTFKTVDPAEGEIYRPLAITPPIAVNAPSDVLVFDQGQSRVIRMTVTANQDNAIGQLRVETPDKSWTITPSFAELHFEKTGESHIYDFLITAPERISTASLTPVISTPQGRFHHAVTTLNYPHLPYMSVVRDATVNLQSLDIKITPRKIGYITGAGDDVPASLRQIGYEIDLLRPEDISSGLLNGYEVVMAGIRAFNIVDALAHKNKILFDWVNNGGTMIVQYNVNRGLVTNDIAPYPLTLSRDRITEENAPVQILVEDHPALTFPNVIGQTDFEGWAQERGLYFPNSWDEAYTPLLEMNDTGEKPTQGALLVAPYGKGHYVYSGLSWFRHLPAGNPGAYRLLSNLIALGYSNSKS